MTATLRLPGFARVALSYVLCVVAEQAAVVALALLVFASTGDVLATTALFVAAKVVPAVLAPVVTARVEPLGSARALGLLYAGEAVVLALVAVLQPPLWVVLALALLDGLCALTARSLLRAASAALLGERLRDGNALLNVGFSAGAVGGPALAGLLASAIGAAAVVGVAAALFAALALLSVTSRRLPAASAAPESWWRRLRDGLAFAARERSIRWLLVGQGLALVFFTSITPVEVVYAKETLGTSDLGFGVLLGCWGAGVVVGSLLYARSTAVAPAGLIAGATLLVGLGYAGIAVAPTLLVACLASVVGGIGNGVQWIAVMTAIQEATPPELQARVVGLLESVGAALPGIGFLLGGALAATISPRASFAVAAAGVFVLVAAGTAAVRLRPRPRRAAPSAAA